MDERLFTICATCTFGLESVVKKELNALGYTVSSSDEGVLETTGTAKDILRLNMNLRCADRVLIKLASGSAQSFDELFELAENTQWENILNKNSAFDVAKVSCVRSKLMSQPDCQRIVKKAIVNRLMRKFKTATLKESGEYYPIFVKLRNDIATLYLNTSGDGLNKRGYRIAAGEAPIKETLAAGIIMLTNYSPEKQFADVMCGSGTLVIEAAMIAAGMAPGLHRSFAVENWGMLNEADRTELDAEAMSRVINPPLRLLGSDIDPHMVKLSVANAKAAGVSEFTSFQKLDMAQFRSRKKCGVMAVNPPYGQRLGNKKSDEKLYRAFGEMYAQLSDWELAVICADPGFEKAFGSKSQKNRKLFNGNIKSYLYFYGINM